MLDLKHRKILVTGGSGFLGAAVVNRLRELDVAEDRIIVPRSSRFDLTDERAVIDLYDQANPDVVIHLAAEVGGIGANMAHPGRFFFANMSMGLHLIEHARRRKIRKFVQVGTVCAYPKFAPIPFREVDLWNGYPEETNAPYGIAKKALFVMLDAYKREYDLAGAVVVPVNLYGPRDNFDPRSSHVIPALIRKCEEATAANAPEMVCWGTGSATREFLYVNDAAEAVVRAAQRIEDPTPINLGTGNEISIRNLVTMIAEQYGFKGKITWDATKPDGQPRRCLDTSRAQELLDWKSTTPFSEGLATTIKWYRNHLASRE